MTKTACRQFRPSSIFAIPSSFVIRASSFPSSPSLFRLPPLYYRRLFQLHLTVVGGAAMRCPACGAEVVAEAVYCHKCGHRLDSEGGATPQDPPPAEVSSSPADAFQQAAASRRDAKDQPEAGTLARRLLAEGHARQLGHQRMRVADLVSGRHLLGARARLLADPVAGDDAAVDLLLAPFCATGA